MRRSIKIVIFVNFSSSNQMIFD